MNVNEESKPDRIEGKYDVQEQASPEKRTKEELMLTHLDVTDLDVTPSTATPYPFILNKEDAAISWR
jgi:hypothetical protein